MSDSADLVCFDDHYGMELGWFWNTANPRYIFRPHSGPASASGEVSRALWRMLSEHVGHDLRLLGEQSHAWEELDCDQLVTVGGDRTLGWDPSVAEYVAGWPPATVAGPPTAEAAVYAMCVDDGLALRLGWVGSVDGRPPYIHDVVGKPAFGDDQVNRALWKLLADHVYHDVRFVGAPDLTGQIVIEDLGQFLADWPG